MASNSKSNKYPKASIDQLMAVIGVSKDVAKHLLSVCHGDVQMAVNLFLEDSEGSLNIASTSQVRDPIPPQQEVLVQDPGFSTYNTRFKRTVHSVFDSFRDFQVETSRQEEMLSGSDFSPKLKKLEDLFRPPLDLVLHGTFQDARDVGVAQKKWLMVNVQNVMEFACQILNRDIWSNKAIRTIVKEQFIFWQVYCDSAEGQRYSAFYNVTDWPYVAIIDPRTGECMRVWNKIEVSSFCDILLEFLCQHHFDEQPASKRVKMTQEKSIVDANEDEQLAAAIKASLVDSSASSSRKSSSSDTQPEITRLHFTSNDESESRFLLRYPDGSREIVVLPLSATVKALMSHMSTKGYSPERNYHSHCVVINIFTNIVFLHRSGLYMIILWFEHSYNHNVEGHLQCVDIMKNSNLGQVYTCSILNHCPSYHLFPNKKPKELTVWEKIYIQKSEKKKLMNFEIPEVHWSTDRSKKKTAKKRHNTGRPEATDIEISSETAVFSHVSILVNPALMPVMGEEKRQPDVLWTFPPFPRFFAILGHIWYKMWQSLVETAKNNPFGSPFHVAHCESSSSNELVKGRNISATATVGEAGGRELTNTVYFNDPSFCV
ncbi:hypothetical protein L9F63_019291, partial [Diploptera punctata]